MLRAINFSLNDEIIAERDAQKARIGELEAELAASLRRCAQLEADLQFYYNAFCDQCRPTATRR